MKTSCVSLQGGLLIVALLTLGAACHKAVDPEYPNERGELLTNLNGASSTFDGFIDWSADGTELYYLTAGSAGYQIQAVNVQSRAVRLVGQDNRWIWAPTNGRSADWSVLSADGQFIYLMMQFQRSAVSYPYYLYQIDTHKSNQIAVVDSTGPNVYSLSAASSPDGRRFAFRYRYDSVRIYQLDANTSIRLAGSRPVGFSPDGSRLILELNSALYQIVALTDLSTSLTNLRPPTAGPTFSRGAAHWHAAGIRYVYSDFNFSKTNPSTFGLFLWNVTQQTSTLLWPDPKEEFPVQSDAVFWSRDGQQIAFSTANWSQSVSGSRNHILYTTNLTTLKTTKVATITLRDDEKTLNLSPLLISPDNRKLAYAVGNTVYIISI